MRTIFFSVVFLGSAIAHASGPYPFMQFGNSNFRRTPFPGEHLRLPDGSIDSSSYGSMLNDCAGQIGLQEDIAQQLALRPPAEQGFGTTSAIYFPTHGQINVATLPNRDPSASLSPPDPHASLMTGGVLPSVFLVGVQPGSPDFGRLYPIITGTHASAGGIFQEGSTTCFISVPWCPTADCEDDVIVLAPLQGVPLLPNTTYAAVVTNAVTDNNGTPLAASGQLNTLKGSAACSGPEDGGWTLGATPCAAYTSAIGNLRTLFGNTLITNMVGLSVFKTGDPTAVMKAALADATASHMPQVTNVALSGAFPGTLTSTGVSGVMADYCMFQGNINMPVYQSGAPPYAGTLRTPSNTDCLIETFFAGSGNPALCGLNYLLALDPEAVQRDGGGWTFPGATPNTPAFIRNDPFPRIFITIPRRPMPPGGYPVVVWERGGLGSDLALEDRIVESTWGYNEDFSTPGATDEATATQLSRAGYATIVVDNPLNAARNANNPLVVFPWKPTEEDAKIFNPYNAAATRDNIRQAALELALIPPVLNTLTFDASRCPVSLDASTCDVTRPGSCAGSTTAKFDTSQIVVMGHSVGATVAPLAMAVQPMFKAEILSGAGGSFLDNVLYKQQPRMTVPADISGQNGNLDMRYAISSSFVFRDNTKGETHTALNLLQWLAEPADVPVYNQITAAQLPLFTCVSSIAPGGSSTGSGPIGTIVCTPTPSRRFALTFQGIVDHYIEPPIANAANLSLGLNEVNVGSDAPLTTANYDDRVTQHGPDGSAWSHDNQQPAGDNMYALGADFRAWTPLSSELDLGGYSTSTPGRSSMALPVQNASVVVQHPSDGVQDGHEVMFQTAAPKHEYKCFLRSLAVSAKFPSTSLPNGPVVPSEMTGSCCEHPLSVSGKPLYNTCDCCVAVICQDHPECCEPESAGGAWSAACVGYYQNTYKGLCNDGRCDQFGPSNFAASNSDKANYGMND